MRTGKLTTPTLWSECAGTVCS